ncbi:hypothetical protein SCHPADRAFT_943175 [Schizopora paradoxa]|uniref:Golgi apparatus membrane protein TVP38 n=1 Tax=Schizopora paradoxa TaxID=27342 RepID=A0A0H2RKQ2_9AGAM|nr:hypothetical protein SCHPADRAFT_943175 [Schizopora paradoxa]
MSNYSVDRLYDPPAYPPSTETFVPPKPPSNGPRRSRTPSPTRSEIDALNTKGIFSIKASMNGKSKKDKIIIYAIMAVLAIITILFAIFHKQIIDWLQPTADKIHNMKLGWLIPVAILFVMSFPPLVGHEIVMILVGVVWGLGPGFAIAAAGTLLGEIGNFFLFKYMCHARGEKYERTKIDYACLARIVREGGLKVAVIARYSVIPPHFTTSVFATCGMKFWVFLVSAILSLPRHFATVYIGVSIEDESNGSSSKKEKLINFLVLGVTIVVSIFALRYINNLSDGVKQEVIYERRKARQARDGLSAPPYDRPDSLEAGQNYTVNVPLRTQAPADNYRYGRGDGRGY